jgi:DNA-directed RNA polymerase specialized sigma24 family protein
MMKGEEVEAQDFSIMHLQEGGPDAFKVLFFQFYPEFLSFSVLFLQDRVAASRLTLEAFFLLWDRHTEFDTEKKVKSFLYLAVRNKCLNYMKSVPRMAGTPAHAPEGIPSSLPTDVLEDIFVYAAREV